MNKQIILSFKPEFFRPILYNMKKYEYRKRFCKEATNAYLYLSSPVCEVIGIVEFGIPISVDTAIKTFSKESIAYKRLQACIDNGEKVAIPIISLQLYKHPVHISKIKGLDSTFSVPRSYMNICKHPLINDYLKRQPLYDTEFQNSHKTVYKDNIGMTCSEMELTSEFEEKDRLYHANLKYNLIKSGYIHERFNKKWGLK